MQLILQPRTHILLSQTTQRDILISDPANEMICEDDLAGTQIAELFRAFAGFASVGGCAAELGRGGEVVD